VLVQQLKKMTFQSEMCGSWNIGSA